MSRVWVTIKRFGRVIKFLFICLVLTVCVFMIWRIFAGGTPSDIKTLIPTVELKEAYAAQGEELYMFEQQYDDITRADYNSGYFAVPESVFIPDANQAQIVFRYNNSTVSSMAKDYSLDEVPDREQELFDVSLVLYIDLTPDNLDDNEDVNSEGIKKIRVLPSAEKCARTTLHSFYRYSFDFDDAEEAVDIKQLMDEGLLIAVHAHFYYNGDLDYEERPYGALNLYYSQRRNHQVEFSSKDKKALED